MQNPLKATSYFYQAPIWYLDSTQVPIFLNGYNVSNSTCIVVHSALLLNDES